MKKKYERGRQTKRLEDNINKWSKIDIASKTRTAEGRTRFKRIAYALSWTPTSLQGYGISTIV